MNDPRRPELFSPPQAGPGPYQPQGYSYAPYADPAYADQAAYTSTYGGVVPQWAPTPNETNPTRQLPRSWQQDEPPPGGPPSDGQTPPPPQGPRSPWWLWVAAAAAVVLVVALVVALVITNGSAKQQTAIEPLPPMPTPSSAATRTPTATAVPPTAAPPTGGSTTPPTATTGTETVVYNVSGDGRAIGVIYMDTGEIMQHEFNVTLPWTKQVSLTKSAVTPASLTVINIGHNVTCTVTVAGVQVSQRTGVGMTICQGTL